MPARPAIASSSSSTTTICRLRPPVGGLSAYLARSSPAASFSALRDVLKRLARRLPRPLHKAAKKTDEFARGMAMGGTLFEELGFYYVGPVDGHNLDQLVPVLENVRDMADGPVLIHVVTQKGKGYAPAEAAADKYHGVQKFDVITGEQVKAPAGPPSYTSVFAKALVAEAANDPTICAITAAMPAGTGLDKFASAYPERFFDVGIAEQHGVTFAAGLAAQGHAAVRGDLFDLPCSAPMTRSSTMSRSRTCRCVSPSTARGLVGADGATHAGSFDITYLATLPNFVSDGRRRRGRAGPYGPHLRDATILARSRCAIRAATAPASRCPRPPNGWR